jgi:hypothetical protein
MFWMRLSTGNSSFRVRWYCERKLAREALLVVCTPVGNQPHEALAVDAPTPRRPDRTSVTEVALLVRRFRLRLLVAGDGQDRVLGIVFDQAVDSILGIPQGI